MAKGITRATDEQVKEHLISALTHKDGKVFVDKGVHGYRGFLYCSSEQLDGKNVLFIHLCVIKPGDKQRALTNELISFAEKYARSIGLGTMVFLTSRNPKAFERKYKFKLEYYMMTRKVRNL